MARPEKQGIDYFPLDVYIDQDDKVMLIEAEFGILGFAIIIKLFMKIYSEGYFYSWSKRQQLLFSRKVNADINIVCDVVNECINWGLFNQKLFKEYGVLTSRGIQKRYIKASERRKNIVIDKSLLLLSKEDIKGIKNLNIKVNVHVNSFNADNNKDNEHTMSTETPQSKVKESKVNKSKEEKDSMLPTKVSNDSQSDVVSIADTDKEAQAYKQQCLDLAKLLRDKILERNPSFKLPADKELGKWAKSIDYMIRLDKRDPEQIRQIILFSQWNHFWKKNIRSTAKLRIQFDRLVDEKSDYEQKRASPSSRYNNSKIPIGRVSL